MQNWLTAVTKDQNLGALQSVTLIKERPWSLVYRVQFAQNDTYFKACGAGGKFEPHLLQYLAQNQHLHIPNLFAIDLQHNWLLMADAGVLLQESGDITQQLTTLKQLLSGYAYLQIESLAAVESYLKLELSDRRVEKLPGLLNSLLVDERLAAGRSTQSVQKLQAAVRHLLPRFEQVCFDLAATNYAAALDHGDMHRGNIFVHHGEPCLIDWGDACVTHPFCSILIALETTLTQVPADKRVQWIRPLLDSYLAPWQIFGSYAQLLQIFQNALWAAYAARALNMAHMFKHAPAQHVARWLPWIAQYLEKWVWYTDFLDQDVAVWMQASEY